MEDKTKNKVRLILPDIICIQGKMYKPYVAEILGEFSMEFIKVLALKEITEEE
jgi:hypothetical protein